MTLRFPSSVLRRAILVMGGSAGALALAGCIPPASDAPPAPRTEPVAAPAPEPAPAPPPSASADIPPLEPHPEEWIDQPQTAGDWRWRAAGTESVAEFSDPAGAILARLVCTADRQVLIAVAGSQPTRGVRVRTETRDALLTANLREGWLETRLVARDAILDAMAFSRGRFALEVQGGRALYLPSYPELTRVLEDCRR
ncbi:hypothetical protein [Alteraurantiacibacter palmitatis]|uniref:Uncharacterized protein n=1 Tax=Alteraurantiacibacter palmitatis TaxID=2054628 RepID=A0ABV7E4B7_9SPHN